MKATKPNGLDLPDLLAKLPRMAFTARAAPSAAAQKSPDIAYDIRSSESLISEYERREARLRSK